nr:unnamed protein product [Digitaria exilis]
MSSAGSLEFKFDYFGTKNLGIGEAVYSNLFSAGGHQWRIVCFPHGYRKKDEGKYLSIYLQLMGESKNVKAIFEAFAMGRDGKPSSSHAERCVRVYPPDGYSSWGYARFVNRSDLEKVYVVNGFATIMCVPVGERVGGYYRRHTGLRQTYDCPELKKKCIDFVAEEKNFKKTVLTDGDGFVRLAHKFGSIGAQISSSPIDQEQPQKKKVICANQESHHTIGFLTMTAVCTLSARRDRPPE